MQLRPLSPRHTKPRRALATAAAILALAVPLSSCGFDYATDRYYTPAAGANTSEGVVDVMSAVVVSAEKGSGTFVASLSNNDLTEDQTFTAVSGETDGAVTAEFEPVTVPAGALVNLADPATDIVITGDFGPGSVVPMVFDFGNGERVSLNVPVVSDAAGYWEGMDAS